jgi:hypothetical protein
MYEFPHSGPVHLKLRLGAGELILVAEERESVVIELEPEGGDASQRAADEARVDLSGDQLTVDVPEMSGGWLLRRSARVSITCRLPLDSTVRAKLGSADARCEGRLGGVAIEAGSGDIHVAEVAGPARLRTGSGDIRIDSAGGQLQTEAGSGDITVGWAAGPVHSSAASGNLHIQELAGPGEATTASGDITVNSIQSGRVALNAASGDIKVGVRTGTKVWLDLRAQSGDTRADLNVGATAPEGGPQASLEVRTMSGDIHVYRA